MFFSSSNLVKLDLDLDLDPDPEPHSEKLLDPGRHGSAFILPPGSGSGKKIMRIHSPDKTLVIPVYFFRFIPRCESNGPERQSGTRMKKLLYNTDASRFLC